MGRTTTTISIRLPLEAVAKLRGQAEREKKSVNALVGQAVARFLGIEPSEVAELELEEVHEELAQVRKRLQELAGGAKGEEGEWGKLYARLQRLERRERELRTERVWGQSR